MPTALPTPPLLLTVPETMALLKVGRHSVYNLIRSKRLPSLTIGRSRRIPADAVRRLIDTELEAAA
ncbi:helix-turn-helix domain-containing protein [Streptomyces sp. NPDC047434]|uniref:helix-turn-helix domain-containing protein n=1 Tax=Streptomyces sp. NPDC047434 TaxID=3155143 RepID=UPI0034007203